MENIFGKRTLRSCWHKKWKTQRLSALWTWVVSLWHYG